MSVHLLKNLDPTFHLIKNITERSDIETITDTYALENHSIVFIKNKKFLSELKSKDLNAKKFGFIIEKKFFDSIESEDLTFLELNANFVSTVQDVNISMSKMSKAFFDKKFSGENKVVDGRILGTASIHPTALVAQNAFIGDGVKIGANVVIHAGVVINAGAEIGDNSEIFANTSIYHKIKIGNNVRIHANCTIGSDGFGYNFSDGVHLKVWHMGGVIIHDHVEIGSNSSVDSGTFSPTIIGEGTKIDNQVQVGHNCKVGKHVIICAQSALAGSCILKDYVVMAGMSAVNNGITVGPAAQIAAFSGVTSDVGPKEVVGGFPARDLKEWMKGVAYLRKLTQKKGKE